MGSCDVTNTGTWTMAYGFYTGTGKVCSGFVEPLLLNLSARSTLSPQTDTWITAKAWAIDRCDSGETWELIVETPLYKGGSPVETNHHAAQYQNCGQSGEHEYFMQAEHRFYNEDPAIERTEYTARFF
jgi:hypothetical protein